MEHHVIGLIGVVSVFGLLVIAYMEGRSHGREDGYSDGYEDARRICEKLHGGEPTPCRRC